MKWLALAGAVALIAAQSASAKPIASDEDSGDVPTVSVGAWINHPRRTPRIVVRAWPAAPVEAHVDVQCFKGSGSRRKQRNLAPQAPPIRRRVALTMHAADDCYVSVDASYEDIGEQAGRMFLALFR